MKRERTTDNRDGDAVVHHVDSTATRAAHAASPPLVLEADLNTHPQRVVDKGGSGNEAVVVNSPYGEHRARYGWGNLFAPVRRAVVPGYSNIHIGVSSLNAVPGKSNRVMKPLLQQYRRKFNCLEHCYPYHKVADQDTWRCWAEMVRSSNTPDTCGASVDVDDDDGGNANKTHTRQSQQQHHRCRNAAKDAVHCVDRFIFTIKANNLLTHVKHLALDAELEAHMDMFFRDRCPALGPFLGPVLVQLPPYFHCTPAHLDRLVAFAARLPTREVDVLVQDMTLREEGGGGGGGGGAAAVRLVRHDSRARVRTVRRRLIRIAVEFRHKSWYTDEVFAVLRRLGWSLVVAHHAADATFATHVDTGTSFLYARLHGAVDENVGDYGPVRMNAWATMVQQFLTQPTTRTAAAQDTSGDGDDVREVYIFLNNNSSYVKDTTSSVVDATYLAERLSLILPPPPSSPSSAHPQQQQQQQQHAASRASTTHAVAPAAASMSPARTQPHNVVTRRSRSRSSSSTRTQKKRSRSSSSNSNSTRRSRSRSNSATTRRRSRSRSNSSTSSTRGRRTHAKASGASRSRAVKIE